MGGNVDLEIQIDATGQIRRATVVSGPEMLRGAAIESLNAWKFKPALKDGVPIEVVSAFTTPFVWRELSSADSARTAAENKVFNDFISLRDKCSKAVERPRAPSDQVQACLAAAKKADEFGSTTRFKERRSSHIYLAKEYIQSGQYAEAVRSGNKAVEIGGVADPIGVIAAYGTRGQALALSGDLHASDRDLTVAEDMQRQHLTDAGAALVP